ncbi:MAG: SDR family oxidoreductase [Acidimicrobiales bacterium]|jgi:NAD(P)-dependent dehydrogenase (short-subunit alcohol dehydrogenase family)
MTGELEGRTALVTGASRGIGLAIAQRFVEAGASVVISSRHQDNLDEAVATFAGSPKVHAVVAHVGRRSEADRLVAATVDHFGTLDVLVNNAATNPYFGPLVDISDSQMQKTYEVNQASILTHSAAAWHHWMRDHGGVIINIASIGGLGPEPGVGWYSVTKAAVIHLTKQLAWELAPSVRVNAIAPGLVRTELARGLWQEHEAAIAARIPLQRLGEPDDVAAMALVLASDASSWITGQVLVVDGGTTNQPTGGVG